MRDIPTETLCQTPYKTTLMYKNKNSSKSFDIVSQLSL